MPVPPVAAAPLSPFSLVRSWSVALLLGAWLACAPGFATAQPGAEDELYVVDIELQTADEFIDLLRRAEQLLIEGAALPADEPKVSFVLHGPVLRNLVRDEYLDNKELVDLAASLTAMDVIEVKACQTWMRLNGLEEGRLLPFVQTVPYGPGAVKAMLESNTYTRF